MVEQLEDIYGYLKLGLVDRIKFAVALKHYLDDINPDVLKDMDIIEVHKSKLGKSVYYCVFVFGDKKQKITISFKRSMMYKKE